MRTRDLKSVARRAGRDAGINAAGWAFEPGRDRNATETARVILGGIEDGDPEIMDAFRIPNLSGEFADDPTPQSLASDCGLADDDPRYEWLADELATEWENAAHESFWYQLAKDCRAYLHE